MVDMLIFFGEIFILRVKMVSAFSKILLYYDYVISTIKIRNSHT
jgi:hypothetical protein